MKRVVSLLICLVNCVLLSQAQGSLLGKMAHRTPRMILKHDSLSLPMQRKVALQMREHLLKPFTPLRTQAAARDLAHFTQPKRTRILQQYRDALTKTQTLAKSLDATIFYQGTSEGRHLLPQEIIDAQQDILKVLGEVKAAAVYFSKDTAPALQQAETYLRATLDFYQMCGTGMLKPLEKPLGEPRRAFNPDVFFLREPKGPEAAQPIVLPQQVRVAIITDYGVLEDFQRMQANEHLPLWQFDVYHNPEEFLQTPGHQNYDLVLTDVVIDHGGGLYLARQLRLEKYPRGIVALTAFGEESTVGMELYAAGMDGMIMLSDIDPYLILERPSMFAQKLRAFFYYHPLKP